MEEDLDLAMASITPLRALGDTSDAVLVTLMDLDDLTVVWRSRPGAAAMLGLDVGDGVGRPAWEWMSPEGARASRNGRDRVLAGNTLPTLRHRLRHRDGSMVPVVSTAWRVGRHHLVSVTVSAR